LAHIVAPYRPLIVALGVALVAAILGAGWAGQSFMGVLMGVFLIIVGTLKLLDIAGFANSFTRYDLVAMCLPVYGRVYPFLETGLGILFLTSLLPVLTHAVTLAIMMLGAAGAMRVVARKLVVSCACAGAGWAIPVGWVTVIEYSIMALMAAAGLWGIIV
jgi:hypothetical protein